MSSEESRENGNPPQAPPHSSTPARLAPSDVTPRSFPSRLADFIAPDPARLEIVLPKFISIIQSLEKGHAEGRQHEFLSPQTIYFDAQGRAEITSSQTSDSSATIALRSPKYSAPEIFQERSASEGCRARDSYVLGFILYETLLGTKLFGQQTKEVGRGSPSEWLAWHASTNSRATPVAELVDGFPALLSTIVSRMMEKDPAQRMTDLGSVARALANSQEATKVYGKHTPLEGHAGAPGHEHAGPGEQPASQAGIAQLVPTLWRERGRHGILRSSDAPTRMSRLRAFAFHRRTALSQWLSVLSARVRPAHVIVLLIMDAILMAYLIFAWGINQKPSRKIFTSPVLASPAGRGRN
jgi:hypothetical protein